jgi:hypothetical protein
MFLFYHHILYIVRELVEEVLILLWIHLGILLTILLARESNLRLMRPVCAIIAGILLEMGID